MTTNTAKTPAEIFRAMADRVEKNPEEFQGGYVILSPSGSVCSHTFFDPQGDEMAFWAFVSSQVQVSASEATQAEQVKANPYGVLSRQR